MWCTRWFIPLLLLPLPSAPPYFLALFLISLTLHAHPCFYCIILLTALFLSSCYWQPVPIDTPVSSAWSIASNATITTFASALAAVAAESRPAVVRLADRCWCEMSASKLFEPFDIAKWESASVEALKEEMEEERKFVEMLNATVGTLEGTSADTEEEGLVIDHPKPKKSHGGLFSSFKTPFSHRKTTPTPSPASTPPTPVAEEAAVEETPVPATPTEKLPLIRREYDLRPYGLSMVVDFGWSR
ncbi:hypothetical protein FA95DRAFT_1560870 [Auriscalpium vulgare]|uniref:Uncharacterized protein n=1 Tax=Auriscalpium vulgare TaxID=40419 RepID=A0ACB8RPU9_9AGAM|nr:hypothetical protein FA95DRAFT_1560870 [Auriscalpium vulgare]